MNVVQYGVHTRDRDMHKLKLGAPHARTTRDNISRSILLRSTQFNSMERDGVILKIAP